MSQRKSYYFVAKSLLLTIFLTYFCFWCSLPPSIDVFHALHKEIDSLNLFFELDLKKDLIYIYKTQCASVCLSAIEIKLETFRYKQTYESYITFSRKAKYGILISIRIVYGGLRAYIYSTVAKCATNSCHKITS